MFGSRPDQEGLGGRNTLSGSDATDRSAVSEHISGGAVLLIASGWTASTSISWEGDFRAHLWWSGKGGIQLVL